jgi:hypothetical protein
MAGPVLAAARLRAQRRFHHTVNFLAPVTGTQATQSKIFTFPQIGKITPSTKMGFGHDLNFPSHSVNNITLFK